MKCDGNDQHCDYVITLSEKQAQEKKQQCFSKAKYKKIMMNSHLRNAV